MLQTKKHWFVRMLCLILTLCLCIVGQPWTAAAAEAADQKQPSQLYLKELKMFHGLTKEDVEKDCESQDFILSDVNLNEGAGGFYTALGYKTTTNKDEAITDITLLDQKLSAYNLKKEDALLDQFGAVFETQAQQINVLVEEFRKNYNAEEQNPNAVMVCDMLNFIRTDDGTPLGDYFLQTNDATAFLRKFVQRGNMQVVQLVVSTLTYAAAEYSAASDNHWISRLRKSEIPYKLQNSSSMEMQQYSLLYQDSAKELYDGICQFAENYTTGKSLYDQYGDSFGYSVDVNAGEDQAIEELLNAGTDCRIPEYVQAISLYELLSKYEYCTEGEKIGENALYIAETDEMTEDETTVEEPVPVETASASVSLADYFIQLANDPEIDNSHLEKLYPLAAALTAAQRTAISVCSFASLRNFLPVRDDYLNNRSKLIQSKKEELVKAGCKDGTMSVWQGVDTAEWDMTVAYTSRSIQKQAAGLAVKTMENGNVHAQVSTRELVTTIAGFAYQGYTLAAQVVELIWDVSLTKAIYKMLTWTTEKLFVKGFVIASGLLGYTATAFMSIVSFVNAVMLVKTFLDLYTMIQTLEGRFGEAEFVEYSQIPQILFDIREKMENGTVSNYMTKYRVVSTYSSYDNKLQEQLDKLDPSWHTLRNATYHPYGDGSDTEGDPSKLLYWNQDHTVGKFIDTISKDTDYHVAVRIDDNKRGKWNSITLYKYYDFIKIIPGRDKVSDLSGYENFSNKFVAIYTTNDKAAGEPIPVPENGGLFIVQTSAQAPEGYKALALVEGTAAEDIQSSFTADHEAKYLFYPGSENAVAAGNIADGDTFVSEIMLSYYPDEKLARDYLISRDYEVKAVNLTPGNGYTYLGVKYSKDEKAAVRDLRVAQYQDGMQIGYGDGRYSAGTDARNVPSSGLVLFNTNSEGAGSPILDVKITDTPLELGNAEGWEPACLFCGGNAVDMTGKNESKGKYIYFLPKEQFTRTEKITEPPYIAGFSYFATDRMDITSTEDGFFPKSDDGVFEIANVDGNPINLLPEGARSAHYNDNYIDQIYLRNAAELPTNAAGKKYVLGRRKINSIYFGTYYTFNPYRAIYGVSALVTGYAAHGQPIKQMTTPAGTLVTSNVHYNNTDRIFPGVTLAYETNVNDEQCTYQLTVDPGVRQKAAISSITVGETNILTHYLMTLGPSAGRLPYQRGDIAYTTTSETMDGYLPLCDMRTPDDLSMPVNFAFDTVNAGANTLYLYQHENAGGRKDSQEAANNRHVRKKRIAAVVAGTGNSADEAIASLYANAAEKWQTLAQKYSDLPNVPLLSELDEIIPVDLSNPEPWYSTDNTFKTHHSVPSMNGDYGSPVEKIEKRSGQGNTTPCAYIGVIRTNDNGKSGQGRPVCSVMKYYSSTKLNSLNFNGTECTLAGGPISSAEGSYYLFYAENSASGKNFAPITDLKLDHDIFINGHMTGLSYQDTNEKTLPSYSSLRMRPDEQMYIHCAYDLDELPYIEGLFIGYGNSKKEAYIDLLNTGGAFEATDVDCNHNAGADTYIAIGYRRTTEAQSSKVLRDVFLYSTDNPTLTLAVDSISRQSKRQGRNVVYSTAKGTVNYTCLCHQKEPASLLKGTNHRQGLYLYYTMEEVCGSLTDTAPLPKIRNLCFTYGDLTPVVPFYAMNDSSYDSVIQDILGNGSVSVQRFDKSLYRNIVWEAVLGIHSGQTYSTTAEVGEPMSLNYGVLPKSTDDWHMEDNRVMMYVSRNDPRVSDSYTQRPGTIATTDGFAFASEMQYGQLYQVK